ncbi:MULTISPECIES: glycosyltransferase family 2 protein [unclassified Mesotoga]|uniref:glycosyltransferase family 2 protein n=1 Tax=unclassified Mesotoga TaxID=1184398 RepID=UPI0021ACA6AC|nr:MULTISPECIES: glycosyltransferase family 2 protein [unclassified Mesotoga]
MNSLKLPKVSIIIPARNEEKFIKRCVESFLKCDYPGELIEVIVVDGMSEDRTREIVTEISRRDDRVLLIDNERKITPVAMNLGVKASKGEYVFFSGAHSEMPSDYISKCIKHAIETGADNVGGVMKTEPRVKSAVGIAISKVLSSPLGVGGAKFRTGVSKPTEVDTVPFGCYKREVFDRIGYFNEKLVRNQDIEFNLRLKRAGGKIILFPDIELTYYSRSTFKELWKNNFANGFWIITGAKYADNPFSIRHLIPLVFVLTLLIGIVFWVFFSIIGKLLVMILCVYLFLMLIESFSKGESLSVTLLMILAFPILHISYGIGSLCAVIFSARAAKS